MDLSFLEKTGLSMDEIIMSGGDEDKLAEQISAKTGMDKAQAKDIAKQAKGFLGNIPNPFAKK